MPNVAHEKNEYDHNYEWQRDGHEWSGHWYSAPDQWVHTIYRRLFNLLPTRSILEIAPGMGRWTPHLLNYCSHYVGIDIAERCVAHCRRAFSQLNSRPSFLVGDGLSLAGVPDNSVSLVFTFDSLVHTDLDCIASYAPEIYRVLEPGGHAFVHHSNLGEYVKDGELTVENGYRRDPTVTAELAAGIFQRAGLESLVHEKFQWCLSEAFNDCFSLLAKPQAGGATPAQDPAQKVFYNRMFREEVAYCHLLGSVYTAATGA